MKQANNNKAKKTSIGIRENDKEELLEYLKLVRLKTYPEGIMHAINTAKKHFKIMSLKGYKEFSSLEDTKESEEFFTKQEDMQNDINYLIRNQKTIATKIGLKSTEDKPKHLNNQKDTSKDTLNENKNN